MKNKMTLVEFKNYVKNQAQKLLKVELLKEEKNKIENELSDLSENKIPTPTNEIDKSAMSAAKKDIENDFLKFTKIGKNRFEKNLDKKELKKAMSPEKLNEGLSEKGIATVQKQVAELGARETAVKIIDHIISKNLMGMTASDLPDSMTYANGLDEMESLLENGEYNEAFQLGKETAQEMISEEGGEGLF